MSLEDGMNGRNYQSPYIFATSSSAYGIIRFASRQTKLRLDVTVTVLLMYTMLVPPRPLLSRRPMQNLDYVAISSTGKAN